MFDTIKAWMRIKAADTGRTYTGQPRTGEYESINHIYWQQPRDLPPFSFVTIFNMLIDPEVRLALQVRSAPLFGMELAYKEGQEWTPGVQARKPEIGVFVQRQIEHIWRNHLHHIVQSQVWGWSAGEITMKLGSSGLVEVNRFEARHARDTRVLLQKGRPVGVEFARIKNHGKLVAAVVKERRAEWRQWQARFAAAESAGDEESGLQQIWLTDLDRVDRCTSCHLGIADPETGEVAQPLRAHSGTWLDTHRPDRFGCTSCHGGQGEATTWRDAAHEPLPFWSEPMASRELMEARCGACHQEREPPATYWLARGRALMADRNCVACHEVPGHDAEEVRAPRLDGLAGKVSPAWLRGWLGDPREYLERSRMGNFRLEPDEVEALSAFLLEPHVAVELDEVDWTNADAERGGRARHPRIVWTKPS